MGLSTIKCRKPQQNSYIIVEFYQNAEKRKKTPYEWVCTANKDGKRIRVLWGRKCRQSRAEKRIKGNKGDPSPLSAARQTICYADIGNRVQTGCVTARYVRAVTGGIEEIGITKMTEEKCYSMGENRSLHTSHRTKRPGFPQILV